MKIQAWDDKLKKMYPPIEFDKLLRYLIFQPNPNSEAYEALKDHFDKVLWLPFSEVYDINGHELYKGDIFSYIWNNGKREKFIVDFKKGSFMGVPVHSKTTGEEKIWECYLHGMNDNTLGGGILYLGNIHENSELLES